MKTKSVLEIRNEIENKKYKRVYEKSVQKYALEILDNMLEENQNANWNESMKKKALNGAENWKEYSYGGCSLIYDLDIAERCLTEKQIEIWNEQPEKFALLDIQAYRLNLGFELCNRVAKGMGVTI